MLAVQPSYYNVFCERQTSTDIEKYLTELHVMIDPAVESVLIPTLLAHGNESDSKIEIDVLKNLLNPTVTCLNPFFPFYGILFYGIETIFVFFDWEKIEKSELK